MKYKQRTTFFFIKIIIISTVVLILPMLFTYHLEAATVKLTYSKKTLEVGESFWINVTGAKSKVKWSCNSKTILTNIYFRKKCRVTALKAGKATIKAKIGKKIKKCKVKVVKPDNVDYTSEASQNSTVTETPEFSKIVINTPAMPFVINKLDTDNQIQKSLNITDVYYTSSAFGDGTYNVDLFISGSVLVNTTISNNFPGSFSVSWRIFDSVNNVVKSGTTPLVSYAVGDLFCDQRNMIFGMSPGTYTFKIISIN